MKLFSSKETKRLPWLSASNNQIIGSFFSPQDNFFSLILKDEKNSF